MEPKLLQANIRQLHLKQLLDRAAGAVGRQYPYFLINVYLTRIVCTATDTQLTIVAEKANKDGDTVAMGGCVCVPARALLDLINSLPDSPVELAGLPNNALRIACGEYSGVIPGVDPLQHFPEVTMVTGSDSICIDGHELATMHNATIHAVGKKSPILDSIHIDSRTPSLTCVAIDGHRLSLASRDTSVAGVSSGTLGRSITVPSKAFAELARINNNCILRMDDTRLSVESGDTTLIIQLLDGDYPNYRPVIPNDHPGCIVVDAGSLMDIVERVDILSESDGVILDIAPGADGVTGDIQVKGANSAGEILDLVPAEITGDPLQIRVAPKLLLNALRSLQKSSADIIVKYRGDRDALVMLPCDHSGWNERLEIVMPRHIKG